MHISEYFLPVETDRREQLPEGCLQHQLDVYYETFPILDGLDLAIIGVNEIRSFSSEQSSLESFQNNSNSESIRAELYGLYGGTYKLRMADLGNLRCGNTLEDTNFALAETIDYLLQNKIVPVVIGAKQDMAYAQFCGYSNHVKALNLVCFDSRIELKEEAEKASGYLNRIIMHQPGYLFNVAHLASQMYLFDSKCVTLMENMLFDVTRLGILRANLTEAEPFLRNANMVSLNVSAIKRTDMPAQSLGSSNGLLSEEACQLCRFAGLSSGVQSIGFYDFQYNLDNNNQGAGLMAQMIWHFIDGYYHRRDENPFSGGEEFMKFRVAFKNGSNELVFYKSKTTERWWMEVSSRHHQLPFVLPCSYQDYQTACNEELPDRWWKAQQKLM